MLGTGIRVYCQSVYEGETWGNNGIGRDGGVGVRREKWGILVLRRQGVACVGHCAQCEGEGKETSLKADAYGIHL